MGGASRSPTSGPEEQGPFSSQAFSDSIRCARRGVVFSEPDHGSAPPPPETRPTPPILATFSANYADPVRPAPFASAVKIDEGSAPAVEDGPAVEVRLIVSSG